MNPLLNVGSDRYGANVGSLSSAGNGQAMMLSV